METTYTHHYYPVLIKIEKNSRGYNYEVSNAQSPSEAIKLLKELESELKKLEHSGEIIWPNEQQKNK